LERLLSARPPSYTIIPLNRHESNEIRFEPIIRELIRLTCPSVNNPYPFSILNIKFPNFYSLVKYFIDKIKRNNVFYSSLKKLGKAIQKFIFQETNQLYSKNDIIEKTRNALIYWSTVGEVSLLLLIIMFCL
jgi:hypothetical protein